MIKMWKGFRKWFNRSCRAKISPGLQIEPSRTGLGASIWVYRATDAIAVKPHEWVIFMGSEGDTLERAVKVKVGAVSTSPPDGLLSIAIHDWLERNDALIEDYWRGKVSDDIFLINIDRI
jgi:hypothetical protein